MAQPARIIEFSSDAAVVAASPLFDECYYARVAGVNADRVTLADHYVTTGEPRGLAPSAGFDGEFYRATSEPGRLTSHGALVDYERSGRFEGRYSSREALREDATLVRQSSLYDSATFARYSALATLEDASDVEAYLLHRPHGMIPGAFEPEFYCETYPDVEGSGRPPIVHYLTIGTDERRVATRRDLRERCAAIDAAFDPRHYALQIAGELPSDLLQHYVVTGEALGFEPAPDFSPEYYVRRYADVATPNVVPFVHYVLYGRAEGRIGKRTFDEAIVPGKRAFDERRPSIAIAAHAATRTGAPAVALSLGRALSVTHNVIFLLLEGGELEPSFVESACAIFRGNVDELDAEFVLRACNRRHPLEALICNSALCATYVRAALAADIPSVALVHECGEYLEHDGRLTRVVADADVTVVPSAFVLQSLQRELLAHWGVPAANVYVRSQGFLPAMPERTAGCDLSVDELRACVSAGEKTRIVAGAGTIETRKGCDLFVQAAAELRSYEGDIRFVWFGDGYRPRADGSYVSWLADSIERAGLGDRIFFLPSQSRLDALFAIADVFFLSSRVDPMPNVALEAVRHGTYVVGYENASGFADVLSEHPTLGTLVEHGSARAAAGAIGSALTQRATPEPPAELERAYSFDAYVAFVAWRIDEARAVRAAIVASANDILADEFASRSQSLAWRAARRTALYAAAVRRKRMAEPDAT